MAPVLRQQGSGDQGSGRSLRAAARRGMPRKDAKPMGPISLGRRAKGASASSGWRHPAGFAANGACPDPSRNGSAARRGTSSASTTARCPSNCAVPSRARTIAAMPRVRINQSHDHPRNDGWMPAPTAGRAQARRGIGRMRLGAHKLSGAARGSPPSRIRRLMLARPAGQVIRRRCICLLESDARVELARRPARTPTMRWARSNYVSSANARPAERRSCCRSRHGPAALQPCVRVIGRVVR